MFTWTTSTFTNGLLLDHDGIVRSGSSAKCRQRGDLEKGYYTLYLPKVIEKLKETVEVYELYFSYRMRPNKFC